MIRIRHQQPTLWENFFAEEVAALWEPWMRVVDELLEDEALLDIVYDAQGKRQAQSRTRGRQQTPAEVVLRMLILKHVRNWSYETLEREVRANVVYRTFCRIGMETVPDAKTLVRLGQAVGPEAIAELHDRIVAVAQPRQVIRGRKMRVHSLSDRQRLVERWGACVDAHHETDPANHRWAEQKDPGPQAQRDQAGDCDRPCVGP